MKYLLIALLMLSSSTPARAVDLGLLGGVTNHFAVSGSSYFTYGATATFYYKLMSGGLKFTSLSGPSASSGGLMITTGQTNFLAQLKINLIGFFAGINLGLGSTSVGASYGGLSASVATSAFAYGPTIGYYYGDRVKLGIEVDYTLSTATGWVNTITTLLGVKFAISSVNSAAPSEQPPQPATPEPEATKPTPVPAPDPNLQVIEGS